MPVKHLHSLLLFDSESRQPLEDLLHLVAARQDLELVTTTNLHLTNLDLPLVNNHLLLLLLLLLFKVTTHKCLHLLTHLTPYNNQTPTTERHHRCTLLNKLITRCPNHLLLLLQQQQLPVQVGLTLLINLKQLSYLQYLDWHQEEEEELLQDMSILDF